MGGECGVSLGEPPNFVEYGSEVRSSGAAAAAYSFG